MQISKFGHNAHISASRARRIGGGIIYHMSAVRPQHLPDIYGHSTGPPRNQDILRFGPGHYSVFKARPIPVYRMQWNGSMSSQAMKYLSAKQVTILWSLNQFSQGGGKWKLPETMVGI